MGPERLFAYGTLNEDAKQEELFGRRIVGAPDILDGYATTEIVEDGTTYRAAVPMEGGAIEGFALAITEKDLKAADAWEGAAYERVELSLRSGLTAWVYVKKNDG